MSRRTLAVVAAAALTVGALAGCSRSEDTTFTPAEGNFLQPTPVEDAPLTVPYPDRQDSSESRGKGQGRAR